MTSGVETERGYSKGTDTREVNKKGKYKQEKRKQVTRSERKQVIREGARTGYIRLPNLLVSFRFTRFLSGVIVLQDRPDPKENFCR